MFNLGDNKGRYHRFQYHPRNYDEQEETINQREERLKEKMKDDKFDILVEFEKKRSKKSLNLTLLIPFLLFCIIPFFFTDVENYLERKYRFGGIAIYFLLILLGFIFIKRSKKKNA